MPFRQQNISETSFELLKDDRYFWERKIGAKRNSVMHNIGIRDQIIRRKQTLSNV